MRRVLLPLVLLASCDRGSPPTVKPFAIREHLTSWFHEQCSTPRGAGVTRLEDYTLPAGMEQLNIFTVPLRADQTCSGKLANLKNLRVEIQGVGAAVCAVRLGPAEALAPIDPTFIRDWFSDPQLGARAAELLQGRTSASYKHLDMLDGIRIAVSQQEAPSSSSFYLVVDGCGHVADSRPGESNVL